VAERPLLIFTEPKQATRKQNRSFPFQDPYHYPTQNLIKDRLSQQFESMMNCSITDSTEGVEPEYVLVLETVGRIEDFERAVRAIEGMEWLAEIDADDIDADHHFYLTPKINKTLFMEIEGLDKKSSRSIWEELKERTFIDKDGMLQRDDIEEFGKYVPKDFANVSDEIINKINAVIADCKSRKISGRLFLST